MPPFPLHLSARSNSPQGSQFIERSTSSPLPPSTFDFSTMARAFLESRMPKSGDAISPALAPLEPLASLEHSGADVHISTSLNARDILDSRNIATHQLSRRALHTNVIPLSYNLAGAKPGVVVGATLGAVLGFILLSWLIWVLTSAQGTGVIEGSDVASVHVTRRSDARSRRSRRTRTHRSEMSERSSPPRRRERILVEETVRRERSRAPPEPEPRPLSPDIEREFHDVEVEEERRVDGDDVVEVIEEQSDVTPEPPRRKKSGYRTVDPEAYGGGNYEQREVRTSDRRRRH